MHVRSIHTALLVGCEVHSQFLRLGQPGSGPEPSPAATTSPRARTPRWFATRTANAASPCMRWGLIPGWAKEPSIGHKLINARSETALAVKPSFRAAILKAPMSRARRRITTNGDARATCVSRTGSSALTRRWSRHVRGTVGALARAPRARCFAARSRSVSAGEIVETFTILIDRSEHDHAGTASPSCR